MSALRDRPADHLSPQCVGENVGAGRWRWWDGARCWWTAASGCRPRLNSLSSSGGNSACITTASIEVAPDDASASAQAISVPPEETISSMTSTGRRRNSAGSERQSVPSDRRDGSSRPRHGRARAGRPDRSPRVGTRRRGRLLQLWGRAHQPEAPIRSAALRRDCPPQFREIRRQGCGAVQMRLHRDHTVEGVHEEIADGALTDRLAGMERGVLAHVGEIRRNQHQPSGSSTPQRFRRE